MTARVAEHRRLAEASQPLHQDGAADHSIALPGGSWAVWRWVALRSAGFPADKVLSLAFSQWATCADELARLESLREEETDALLEAIQAALDAARQRRDFASTDALARIRRHIKAGRLPSDGIHLGIDPAFDSYRRCCEKVSQLRVVFDRLLDEARNETSRALREIASETLFREALAWQNHPLFETCIQPMLRNKACARSSRQRQHEELLTTYLHRYCVKNDTIGFFGPVGWARFVEQPVDLDSIPGKDLLAGRRVYFEQWAMDLLAEHFSNDPLVKPWIPIRPTPVATIENLTVRTPFRKPIMLTQDEMMIFRSCDGISAEHHLARQFCSPRSETRFTPEFLRATLEKLVSVRLVSLQYQLPLDPYPEQRLRDLLELIEEEPARRQAFGALEQLVADRDAIAAAAGDPEQIRDALRKLEGDFTSITGEAANRAPGEMYFGRTLVFEDCRRDLKMEIGIGILEELGPPLTLILSSARWITWRAGSYCREILTQAFERLAPECQAQTVGFTEFYNLAFHMLSKQAAFANLAQDMQKVWAGILSFSPADEEVSYSSRALQSRVETLFDAPGPGWSGGCYHSPDIMIAAPSVEAIRAGSFHFILGELHIGANTLRSQFLVEQHPHAEDIARGTDTDLPEIRLAPVTPRRYSQRATRIYPAHSSRRQYYAITTLDSIAPFGSTSFPAASLRVSKVAGRLVTESVETGMQFDALQSFAGILARIVVDQFSILPPLAHTPRVLFDKLVVARQAWHFAPEEMDFVIKDSGAEQLVAARRWKLRHKMPRWVFVRIPGEGKPIYVDFDSPIAIQILARRVRNRPRVAVRTRTITVTEMSPGHGEHWLSDHQGNRFSCELRIAAVDRMRARWPDRPIAEGSVCNAK